MRPIDTLDFKYWWLLGAQCLMILGAPIVDQPNTIGFLSEISFAGVLIFAVWVTSHNPRVTAVAVILGALAFLSNLAALNIATETNTFRTLAGIVGTLFFANITYLMLREIFTTEEVDLDTIGAAISVYLLIGVGFGFIYSTIDALDPTAFEGAPPTGNLVNRFVYFSMVTLTTLGYGDITPVSAAARSFSMFQAALGQIYLTVLVARLVGLHLSRGTAP